MSVDKILNLGSDALGNSFQILFPEGIPNSNNPDAVALRIDQSFPMPDESVSTYQIKYKGITIEKTSRSEATSKELTFDVRLDENWEVHDDLRNLYEMTYNPVNGTGLGDVFTRFKLVLQALDFQDVVKKTITFNNCKIKGIKVGDFGQEEEGPIRLTLSFIYGTMTFE